MSDSQQIRITIDVPTGDVSTSSQPDAIAELARQIQRNRKALDDLWQAFREVSPELVTISPEAERYLHDLYVQAAAAVRRARESERLYVGIRTNGPELQFCALQKPWTLSIVLEDGESLTESARRLMRKAHKHELISDALPVERFLASVTLSLQDLCVNATEQES